MAASALSSSRANACKRSLSEYCEGSACTGNLPDAWNCRRLNSAIACNQGQIKKQRSCSNNPIRHVRYLCPGNSCEISCNIQIQGSHRWRSRGVKQRVNKLRENVFTESCLLD